MATSERPGRRRQRTYDVGWQKTPDANPGASDTVGPVPQCLDGPVARETAGSVEWTGGIHRPRGHGQQAALTVAVLGVVFGDIGTSPLYALRECLRADH